MLEYDHLKAGTPVAVLGGGAYGTALAQVLAAAGREVLLWVRDEERAGAMQQTRENSTYLPGFKLHDSIYVTSDLASTARASWAVVAVPSSGIRSVLQNAAFLRNIPVVVAAKGIEYPSLKTMHEVAVDVLGVESALRVLALSGPSFAKEIMAGDPTAVVLAGYDANLAKALAEQFFCDVFRVYVSTDVVGVELGGALKNVIAIAAGAVSGLGFGDNTRTALITRGVAEMTRIAVARGAEPMTLSGLSGLGDLVLTCTGAQSRNRRFGEALARAGSAEDVLKNSSDLVEGVFTAQAAHGLATELAVDAPITRAVYQVLFEKVSVQEALLEVLRRPPKREWEEPL